MDNFSCSEDVLRVVPDTNIIKSGYLYAYLSSRFGVPLIASGTYGAIVQHIEPEHITNLPVPRLGNIEDRTHELIQKAADLQVESSKLREKAGSCINEICVFPDKLAISARIFNCSQAVSKNVIKRMDATYNNIVAQQAEALVYQADGERLSNVGIQGFESNRMKQVFVDKEYGTPFITSREIFFKTIEPERYLQNQLLDDIDSWRINEYDTLIARSGQVGGIIGRGVWSDARLDGFAASPHILRLRSANDEFPPGYVYAFLCLTDVGYQLAVRTATGSSIPFLPLDDILEIKIPTRPTIRQRNGIDELIKKAGELRKKSQEYENEARALVERAIEEGGR
jgi:type I restriction enzyme S subunit